MLQQNPHKSFSPQRNGSKTNLLVIRCHQRTVSQHYTYRKMHAVSTAPRVHTTIAMLCFSLSAASLPEGVTLVCTVDPSAENARSVVGESAGKALMVPVSSAGGDASPSGAAAADICGVGASAVAVVTGTAGVAVTLVCRNAGTARKPSTEKMVLGLQGCEDHSVLMVDSDSEACTNQARDCFQHKRFNMAWTEAFQAY